MNERIGIIAGWGELPVIVARALKTQGAKVYCVGIAGHADPVLKKICDGFMWGGVARTWAHMRFFQRHRVAVATMGGKIFKSLVFSAISCCDIFPT